MSILSNWKKQRVKKELKDFIKHVAYVLHVNDDILTKSSKDDVNQILDEAKKVDPATDPKKAEEFIAESSNKVIKSLPKKSYPVLREYADILAVALCVAFGIRALFLQPFKIPTSSMQPTLFGIHYIAGDKSSLPDAFQYLLFSRQRAKCTIQRSGELKENSLYSYTKYIIFPWTSFNIAGINYNLPGTQQKVSDYALKHKLDFKEGEELCDGWLSLGDHLFVDRFTYHFREPRRGDVLVFNTEGISNEGKKLNGYYYIKRLIGLPGDTIRIKDSTVYIKPKGETKEVSITELNPIFKKIYSGQGGYHGHVIRFDAKHLTSEIEQFTVPDDSYFALGDNSFNSFDSRYWGVIPRTNIIGRGYFVFWPFTRRWGFVDSAPPLDVPTTLGLPSMNLQ